jgi:hypothetical protein
MSSPVRERDRSLQRDRTLGPLLDDAVGILRRHLGTALLLAAMVVVPVELLINGIGLGQLTSSYDDAPSNGAAVFSSLVAVLITTPLVMGMLVRLVLDDAAGEPVSASRCIRTGLDVFAALVFTVLLAMIGIVVGLVAFVIPGVFLAVRWAVVAPVVVLERTSGPAALSRSWELVRGNGWWVLGTLVVLSLLVGVVGLVVQAPAEAAAKAADAQAVALIGSIIGQVIGLPFSAVATILLYFTLRARQGDPPLTGPGKARTGGGERGGGWAPPATGPEIPGGWEPPVPPR